jgi:hypothetical protein
MFRAFAVGIAFAALSGAAIAQTPRTADGHPDLQGLWSAESLTPLERPKEFKRLVVAPEDLTDAAKKMTPDFGAVYDPESDSYFTKKLLSVNGELRTSWIIEPADGKLPLTRLARSILDQEGPEYDNPEERPGAERCLDGLAHPPLRGVGVVIPYLIVQTPTAIVVAAEDIDPFRIIDLTGRTTPAAIRSRGGHSAGRWEGDVLVVETRGFAASDPSGLLFRDVAPVSEGSQVIERFRLASPDVIHYQFTIEDPALYMRPWLAELELNRIHDRFLEYACHEGNSGMVSILTAARLGRQEKPEKKKSDDEKTDK